MHADDRLPSLEAVGSNLATSEAIKRVREEENRIMASLGFKLGDDGRHAAALSLELADQVLEFIQWQGTVWMIDICDHFPKATLPQICDALSLLESGRHVIADRSDTDPWKYRAVSKSIHSTNYMCDDCRVPLLLSSRESMLTCPLCCKSTLIMTFYYGP